MSDPVDSTLPPAPPPPPVAPTATTVIVTQSDPVPAPYPLPPVFTDSTPDIVPDKPKASWIWLKDSSGFPSVTVTMLTVSFWVTTVLYIISQFQSIGPVQFRAFDVGACGAYFGSILGLYFGRRFTDAKYGSTGR